MNVAGFLLFFIILIVLPYVGLYKLFQKAGRQGWEAIIPGYNFYVTAKISGRPAWWVILLFIPLINVFICIGITIDLLKSFGKFNLGEHAAGILLPFIYLPKWGFDHNTKYIGPSASPEFKEKYKKTLQKSTSREWTEAIVFAVLAATLIRTFFIEAYTIPTPSMERSLLVGDFLFVSKLNYGPRTPMTPIAFPFAHHTMPVLGTKAYWDGWELGYHRLPGFSEVKKGDVVVFNYPMDADSPLYRPVDKQENYIKRFQGTPGDTLSVVNSQVYVNGKAMPNPPGEQTEYTYKTNGTEVSPDAFDELNITLYNPPVPTMTAASAKIFGSYSNVKDLKPIISPRGEGDPLNPVFPHGAVAGFCHAEWKTTALQLERG